MVTPPGGRSCALVVGGATGPQSWLQGPQSWIQGPQGLRCYRGLRAGHSWTPQSSSARTYNTCDRVNFVKLILSALFVTQKTVSSIRSGIINKECNLWVYVEALEKVLRLYDFL